MPKLITVRLTKVINNFMIKVIRGEGLYDSNKGELWTKIK